ncbi:28S ribosomal protein S33, mitochondrial [Armadillidium nasatum]|uniref:Small ribosomal subunit protein mS33 n=1 Tax=Armadillidium nasatum TaxID=96803 RepID=A0A5N5SHG1_9CRUS|nr:28S ribosomal protein S33, mitochondrial [Armadillidium nasatum]
MVKLPVKSQIFRYAHITKNSSEYAKKMTRLSNRIFNEVARPTDPSSMRVVQRFSEKPLDLRSDIVNYYPRHEETHDLMKLLRSYGLYRDEHQDFKDEMERLRELRGKGYR